MTEELGSGPPPEAANGLNAGAAAGPSGTSEENKVEVPRPYLEEADSDGAHGSKGIDEPPDVEIKTRMPPSALDIDTALDEGSPHYQHPDGGKISLDLTPLSCRSTGSAADYHQPNQTIIILDWDDTMCPSTACMRHHGLSVLGDPPEGQVSRALQDLAVEAQALLEQAADLAEKVIIVTNAEEGWVDLSCKAWLPELQGSLERAECVSARSMWEPRGIASPAGWKARAFEDAIDRFYSRYQNQSWKNIISIGDAPHEREALSRVVRWAPGAGQGKRCRSKSVKFVLRPSIEQLTREIQMLRESLKEIVSHDDDLDLHFSAESLADPRTSPTSAAG